MSETTNRLFADSNDLFKKACELAGTPVTKRQASKFRNGRGCAFLQKKAASKALKESAA